MISVLILTKNEEQDLPGCLQSVSWSDDVHVFDSFSTDNTVDLAILAGAKVTQRQFDGYASQRNAALLELTYKYSWLLILDADERFPRDQLTALKEEMKNASADTAAFRLRRKDFLGHSWLKYSQLSPFYIRVVKIGKARYHREVNEVMEVDGNIKDIDVFFEHYPFSKGIKHWIDKHNIYSSLEAKRWIDEHTGSFGFSWRKALFSKDFTERRYHQKGLFYKLPGRPLIKWLYMMIWRRAFLDGRAGVTYATLQSIYEYFIVLKTRELLKQRHENPN